MKIICKAELLTAQRGSVWFSLLFRSHLTVIFTCNEISSGVFSLAARCGESFTLVNFYRPCHSLLLSVSHSLSSVCLTSCCSPFVYFSLCNNLHHLPVSNFPFPLPFTAHLLSLLCPLFFTSPLFLCPSISLFFFPGFPPSSPTSHLFSALYMLSCQGCFSAAISDYVHIHVSVLWKITLCNYSSHLEHSKSTHTWVHTPKQSRFVLCPCVWQHYFFSVLHFMFLSCHGGFEILYTQMFWHYFKMSAQLCRCAYKWLVLCYLSVKKYGFQLKQKGLHKKAHTKNSAARPKMLFRAKHEQAPGFPEV